MTLKKFYHLNKNTERKEDEISAMDTKRLHVPLMMVNKKEKEKRVEISSNN
jgi:hypothetical protein